MRRYLTTWQVFCDNSDPLFLQTVQGIIYLCDEGDVSMGRCIARICWDKHHYRYFKLKLSEVKNAFIPLPYQISQLSLADLKLAQDTDICLQLSKIIRHKA